jgi:hypothetical protein
MNKLGNSKKPVPQIDADDLRRESSVLDNLGPLIAVAIMAAVVVASMLAIVVALVVADALSIIDFL